MHRWRRALVTLVVTAATGVATGAADAAPGPDVSVGAPRPAAWADVVAHATAVALAQPAPEPARRSRVGRSALRGLLIGAAAGAALTIFAAQAEGENEGGSFCGQCVLEWGAIIVPVSAGVGAGIGALVGVALPSRQPGPWTPGARPGRRGAGVGLAFRF